MLVPSREGQGQRSTVRVLSSVSWLHPVRRLSTRLGWLSRPILVFADHRLPTIAPLRQKNCWHLARLRSSPGWIAAGARQCGSPDDDRGKPRPKDRGQTGEQDQAAVPAGRFRRVSPVVCLLPPGRSGNGSSLTQRALRPSLRGFGGVVRSGEVVQLGLGQRVQRRAGRSVS